MEERAEGGGQVAQLFGVAKDAVNFYSTGSQPLRKVFGVSEEAPGGRFAAD